MGRQNLSSEIRSIVREDVVSGVFAPRERINEVRLAKRLEISRTPLREALFGLVNEKLLIEVPRRGFFVADLSVEEIRQLYVIRQILDPAALELAGCPDRKTLEELSKLNKKIARAKQVKDIIELDDRWHLLLVEGCENEILLNLIKEHMIRTRRYEFAYFSQSDSLSVATEEHQAIIDALRAGKLKQAVKHLRQNMTSAESPLIDWVKKQEKSNEQ